MCCHDINPDDDTGDWEWCYGEEYIDRDQIDPAIHKTVQEYEEVLKKLSKE